jgi:hypothetical protein
MRQSFMTGTLEDHRNTSRQSTSGLEILLRKSSDVIRQCHNAKGDTSTLEPCIVAS